MLARDTRWPPCRWPHTRATRATPRCAAVWRAPAASADPAPVQPWLGLACLFGDFLERAPHPSDLPPPQWPQGGAPRGHLLTEVRCRAAPRIPRHWKSSR
eukprot:ctg_2401.g671